MLLIQNLSSAENKRAELVRQLSCWAKTSELGYDEAAPVGLQMVQG